MHEKGKFVMKEISDIHKLNKKIKELETELELLRAAFDLSEVGFTLSDSRGVALKVNSSQSRITGHSPETTVGRSMEVIAAENFNQSATMQVVQTKKPVTIEQTLPSGKSYLVYGQPYFDKDGELKYVICNLVDNTEHNHIRQELDATKSNNIELTKTVHQLQEIIDMKKPVIFTSKAMKNLIALCDKVAYFDSTVLILGESGAGKEVISDYIIQKSSRSQKPFLKINCAAIPDNLLESELFGYEAGAFTNARAQGKRGIFEMANGGSILLDEIGELPLHLQSKLLRVLQEKEFFHVGGTKPINSDVRIIAATNRNLQDLIESGNFRKDLFYRLSVIQLTVPALSERREDIPLLTQHFLARFNAKYNLRKSFTSQAMEYIQSRDYEGNVRDLQNVIERVVLLSSNNTIGVREIEQMLNNELSFCYLNHSEENRQEPETLKSLVENYEKEILDRYWSVYHSETEMAEILQVSQSTISRKLKYYNIL